MPGASALGTDDLAVRAHPEVLAAHRDPAGAQARNVVALHLVAVAQAARVHEALRAAGVTVSLREGLIRLSPHAYNTADEMARTAELLDRAL